MPASRRFAAALLSLFLALPVPVPASVVLPAAAAAAVVALHADGAEARARARMSSGGYSRPAGRTPSFARPSAPSRTPSTSGGYARPAPGASGGGFGGILSGGDRSVSRRSSGEALDQYRAAQQRSRTPTVTAPQGGARNDGRGGWGDGWSWGQRRQGGLPPAPGGWYGDWRAPGWAYRSAPRFGVWDGLFLWFLLDHLGRPGYADWFHNHQNDPGYQEWRAEAERRAQDDADLRARLDTLDARLAADEGRPRDPGYLPPGVPVSVAQAATPDTPAAADADADADGGGGQSVFVIILLVGAAALAVWAIRRSGTASRRSTPMAQSPLGTAAGILQRKLSGERYEPSLFRVGMTFTLDPTPFLLAGPASKVTPPGGGGGNALVSVEAVGRLADGGTELHRLYLQGGAGFFQLHLAADGTPDECRWFSLLDEVQPADQDEWAFWLDEREGMIGWPQFQTRDGKLYDRRWSPGDGRVPPAVFAETVTDHRGSRRRQLSAMLYAAPTGAADPAPALEYILVAAVEDAGEAWVEVRAGIDVNPATLSLS
ncbi:DUF2491 family protein [Azospirillum sp. ST 5-10]|uniref:DUF2491 family protein n=1 Tax=unclassified Azospirillum TaxID=2630922 RepID=UPI003F4A12D7